jgi:hypothetical protein
MNADGPMMTTYLLIDPDSGEAVGLHVVADDLASSTEEVAELAKNRGKPLRVERVDLLELAARLRNSALAAEIPDLASGSGGVEAAPSRTRPTGADQIARSYRRWTGR